MITTFHVVAGLAATSVVGLMGYHIATGSSAASNTSNHLPGGIASAMDENAPDDAPPVKANVVVFRSVPAGIDGFNNIIAAHKFDKASDARTASGWCYIELGTLAEEGIDRMIPLSAFDGKSVVADPQGLRGFLSVGLGVAERDRAMRTCPWVGLFQ